MANYTIQLKTIVEIPSQNNPEFWNMSVNQKIDIALPTIFDFTFPFYNQDGLIEWEKRFIKHFYMREIGFETIGLWKMKLEDKLNIIMPMYNKLYLEAKKVNDLTNTFNMKETYNRTNNGNSNSNSNSETMGDNKTLFSDTPQSMVDLNSNNYVTEITQGTVGDTTNTNQNQTVTNNEDYENSKIGNSSGKTQAELLKIVTESIVHIDNLVYNECEELFMVLY